MRRQWELYTYEIAIRSGEAGWTRVILDDCASGRGPDEFARSLMERWINDHPHDLTGGQIFVRRSNLADDPDDVVGVVRVRVWKGGRGDRDAAPAAAAYLGHRRRDVPPWLQRGRRRWLPSPRRSDDLDYVDDDGTGDFIERTRRRRRVAARQAA